jgi:hypothetical protein
MISILGGVEAAFSEDVEAHALWLVHVCGRRLPVGSACVWRGAFAQHFPTPDGLYTFGKCGSGSGLGADNGQRAGTAEMGAPEPYSCTGGAAHVPAFGDGTRRPRPRRPTRQVRASAKSLPWALSKKTPAWDWRDDAVRRAYQRHEVRGRGGGCTDRHGAFNKTHILFFSKYLSRR